MRGLPNELIGSKSWHLVHAKANYRTNRESYCYNSKTLLANACRSLVREPQVGCTTLQLMLGAEGGRSNCLR